ncbi:MAG: hypothetical protein LBV51_01270 [Acholeplasmatales bacterium]|jgi:hypothetical protein|nr:hypothetical protein [Acholeplasmatales bacterium]
MQEFLQKIYDFAKTIVFPNVEWLQWLQWWILIAVILVVLILILVIVLVSASKKRNRSVSNSGYSSRTYGPKHYDSYQGKYFAPEAVGGFLIVDSDLLWIVDKDGNTSRLEAANGETIVENGDKFYAEALDSLSKLEKQNGVWVKHEQEVVSYLTLDVHSKAELCYKGTDYRR